MNITLVPLFTYTLIFFSHLNMGGGGVGIANSDTKVEELPPHVGRDGPIHSDQEAFQSIVTILALSRGVLLVMYIPSDILSLYLVISVLQIHETLFNISP